MRFNFKETIEKAKKLSLSDKEKEVIKDNVLNFVSAHPVREMKEARLLGQEGYPLSRWLSGIKQLTLNYTMPVILILALLLGGGTAYASQSALPGDFLYPVKIDVVEPARGLLNFSDQAKAQWDIVLAQNRLSEAEKLGAEGKLDTTTKNDLAARFDNTVADAHSHIDQLGSQQQASLAARVSLDLEGTLKAHAMVLGQLALIQKEKQDKTDLQDLSQKASVKADEVAKIEAENESQSATSTATSTEGNGSFPQSAAQGKQNAAQNKINEVKNFFESDASLLDASTTAAVNAKIQTASQFMASGDAELAAGQYAQAFDDFQNALQTAQDAKILIIASVTLNADLGIHNFKISTDEHGNSRVEIENESGNSATSTPSGSQGRGDEMKNDNGNTSPSVNQGEKGDDHGSSEASSSVNAQVKIGHGSGEVEGEGSAGVNIGL